MERPLRPAGRLPRPDRRPLARLRATHQGPYRAREGTDKRSVHHVDYSITRVKLGGPSFRFSPRGLRLQAANCKPGGAAPRGVVSHT